MPIGRVFISFVIAVALAGSLFGTAGAAGYKNVIVFGVNRAADNLDPVTQDANPDIWAFMQIYQQLVRVNVKGDGFAPDLAERWTVSPNGKTWTFYLRRDARWSNGDPVTAADAAWSLQRAHDLDGPWQWAMEAVQAMAATDDHTLVITLKEPWAPFLSDVSLFSSSILPAKVFRSAKAEDIAGKPVGSGPFMLTEWKKGDELVMKANPSFFEKGRPRTAELHIRYIPDDNNRMIALQSGDLDGIDYPPFSQVSVLQRDPRLDVQLNPSTAVSHVMLNVTQAPLNNAKFRQALAYATDRAGINKGVCYGACVPATSFMPLTTQYFNKGLKAYTYDVEKAKQLLKESGVTTPVTLTAVLWSGAGDPLTTTTLLKGMWAQIGVTLNLAPLDRAAATQRMRALDYQVYVSGWTNDVPDPSELANYEFDFVTAKSYHTGYHSPQMDKLLADGMRELDPNKRRQIYYQIQDLAIQDSPLIWLYYAPYTIAINKKMHGFVQMATGPWLFKDVAVEQ
ncbi:MAG TPA: ABC transporter substrate-binding protein [bacterium]|nr:ABC transporter substrate-binding protein [bacterium]